MKFLILILTISLSSFANYLDKNLVKKNWNGIEVIWLLDNSFPTYDISIMFDRGAYDDPKGKEAVSTLALNLLTLGTNRYDQEKILDTIDFYGASTGAYTTHEYSTYNVSGLVKDLLPTMKMVCHMFSDATYPKREFNKAISRLKSAQRNIINNHGALASMISRVITLRKTGYDRPVEGTIKSLSRISPRDLEKRLAQYNNSTKKRIYIRGPKELSALESIIKNDCNWSNIDIESSSYPEVVDAKNPNAGGVFLVPVKGANQAQIRIGYHMNKAQAQSHYTLTSFASQLMGGGFTSRLMQVLRVKNGLTYSVSSYASGQGNYGRKGINTFTKNETIVEMLKMIKDTVASNATDLKQKHFESAKIFAKGNYLYGLESTSQFLSTMQYYDIVGRPYSDIYKFPKEVDKLTKKETQAQIQELFGDKDNITVIVGNASLEKELQAAGIKVKVINAKDYL